MVGCQTSNLKIYKVRFNDANRYFDEVVEGELVEWGEPEAKEGYEFIGWWWDGSNQEEFDFNTPITRDIKLVSKWKKM